MSEQPKKCSDCGSLLTAFFYGYGDCSGHTYGDYVATKGYRVDMPTGYGDWDGGPTHLYIPEGDVDAKLVTFYVSEDRCCMRPDLTDPDETDYCPKCQDVMVPA